MAEKFVVEEKVFVGFADREYPDDVEYVRNSNIKGIFDTEQEALDFQKKFVAEKLFGFEQLKLDELYSFSNFEGYVNQLNYSESYNNELKQAMANDKEVVGEIEKACFMKAKKNLMMLMLNSKNSDHFLQKSSINLTNILSNCQFDAVSIQDAGMKDLLIETIAAMGTSVLVFN